MRKLLVFLGALLLVQPIFAGELYGVKMPDKVQLEGKDLVLNGMGVRKKFVIKVYVAGLYLPTKTGSAEQAIAMLGPKELRMHFLTNKATKKRMDKAWWEGFEANSPDKVEELRPAIEKFVNFFGNMRKGDLVIIDFASDGTVTVKVNGQEKGSISQEGFAEALLKVWLGPKPPTEDLKKGLLGGK